MHTCGPDDEYEENDDQNNAKLLQLWEQIQAISFAGDDDWFKVSLAAGTTIEVTADFTNAWGDIDLYLLDAQGNTIDSSTSVSDNEQVTGTIAEDGDLYIRVYLYIQRKL